MKFIKICMILLMLGTAAQSKSNMDEEVSINFKDLSISEFVDLMSKILKKNILFNEYISHLYQRKVFLRKTWI